MLIATQDQVTCRKGWMDFGHVCNNPPKRLTVHIAGMYCSIVEAVLVGDPEVAFSTMKNRSIEFGEILIKMEETYRKKKLL